MAVSWLYFIGSDHHPFVNIGCTSDVKSRLVDLQEGSPWKLRVLHQTLGGMAGRQIAREDFSQHRMEGDWFELPKAAHDVLKLLTGKNTAAHDPLPPTNLADLIHADLKAAHPGGRSRNELDRIFWDGSPKGIGGALHELWAADRAVKRGSIWYWIKD